MVRALYLLKWLSSFRFSSTIPRLGPLPLLLPVSKQPESIVPIFSQEKGVQSIYKFDRICGGSLVARNKNQSSPIPLVGNFTLMECLTCSLLPRGSFSSQNHILTAEITAVSPVVAYISHSNHCLLDCSYGLTGPHHAYAQAKLSGNSAKSCRIPFIAARNPSPIKVYRKQFVH